MFRNPELATLSVPSTSVKRCVAGILDSTSVLVTSTTIGGTVLAVLARRIRRNTRLWGPGLLASPTHSASLRNLKMFIRSSWIRLLDG